MKRTISFLLLTLLAWAAPAQQMTHWVDSVMNTFSLDDKVHQVLIVRVPAQNAKAKDVKAYEQLIRNHKVGGICFFKGTTDVQLQRTLKYQRMAPFPMLVSIDGEWGLGMRLTDGYSFPRQMMMGALSRRNDTLISAMGREVAAQCRMMGIHIDFAPCVDLNSNPLNPVIGARSFGQDKVRVADKAALYAQALQQGGVMAVAKHFPGHGDTDEDSHLDLPVISHPKAYIDSVDLYPFRRLIKAGCRGMMVAHLKVMDLDASGSSSTSERIVNQLLRKEMGFKGLVFTDGMEMGGVTKSYSNGEAELRALLAGCDIVLLPDDVEATVRAITKRAQQDTLFARMLDNKCRAILREKYRMGIHAMNLKELHAPTRADYSRCERISEQIALKAITLVHYDGKVLPLSEKERVEEFNLGSVDGAITSVTDAVAQRLAQADKVVLHLHALSSPGKRKNYGVGEETVDLVRQIVAFNPNTILVIYGSPYILQFFQPKQAPLSTMPAAVVVGYQDLPEVEKALPEVLYGRCDFEGKMPVAVGAFKLHTGLRTKSKATAQADPYGRVKKAGMSVECFQQIDSIALRGIEQKAYPGCQLLVARKGQVVYHRGYGRLTYETSSPMVDTCTIYDLASLTKVCATTLAVMKLVDLGKVKLDDPLSRYLPYLKHTNKKKITIKECLSHCARLKSFDAYYRQLPPACADLSLYPKAADCEECRQLMLKQIADSPLNKKAGYLYSDLGFILLADMVRNVSGQPIDLFVAQQFYQPMGLQSTTFQPRLHGIDTVGIAPTELDTYYRHRLLRGEVHDQNAAALGGVSGHAGLFSTCADLARLYQMLLNGGTLDGKRYLSCEVVDLFNSRHYADHGNRRALGFDKPLIHGRSNHCAPEASQLSFGHTGFTGTMIWADPKHDLLYIFLSNRVYPTSDNNKLSKLNIRTDIQSLIYKSL